MSGNYTGLPMLEFLQVLLIPGTPSPDAGYDLSRCCRYSCSYAIAPVEGSVYESISLFRYFASV